MSALTPALSILILAAIVEAIVEYFIAPMVKPETENIKVPLQTDWRGMALRYSAAGIGVLLCILYDCDLLVVIGLTTPIPYVGAIVTGLLIGRGANYINDFVDRWLVQH
jgi:hypothetical protein